MKEQWLKIQIEDEGRIYTGWYQQSGVVTVQAQRGEKSGGDGTVDAHVFARLLLGELVAAGAADADAYERDEEALAGPPR